MNEKKLWFKNKDYGYGWQPCSKEGWLLTIGLLLAIFVLAFSAEHLFTLQNGGLIYGGALIILIAIFMRIAWSHGEPLKWSWGRK